MPISFKHNILSAALAGVLALASCGRTMAEQEPSPEVFNILNFLLQFCPTDPSEKELMERFAKVGFAAGKTFDHAKLSHEMKKAFVESAGA